MQNFCASNQSKVSLYWAWNLKPRKTRLIKRVKKKDSSKKNAYFISETWHLKKFFQGGIQNKDAQATYKMVSKTMKSV